MLVLEGPADWVAGRRAVVCWIISVDAEEYLLFVQTVVTDFVTIFMKMIS